jgi:hypothetical protein
MIIVEHSQLDNLVTLFQRRGSDMVSDAVVEGKTNAARLAASRRSHSGRMNRPIRRARNVSTMPSALLEARQIETVMYQRLVDFFGSW